MQFPPFPNWQKKAMQDRFSQKHWDILVEYISKLSKKDLKEAMNTLLPRGHKLDLLKRAVAVKRIEEGYSYYEIHNETGLAHQSISQLKKAWLDTSYKSYVEINGSYADKRHQKDLKRIAQQDNKPEPKRYKRTKYGTIRWPN